MRKNVAFQFPSSNILSESVECDDLIQTSKWFGTPGKLVLFLRKKKKKNTETVTQLQPAKSVAKIAGSSTL